MDFTNAISFIVLLYIALRSIKAQSNEVEDDNVCQQDDEEPTCTKCLNFSPSCSWCLNASYTGYRCDKTETLLANQCGQEHLYNLPTSIQKPLNKPIGGYTQLQPQKVDIRMKPGETVTFPILYLHNSRGENNIKIRNSEIESQGLTLKYSSNCTNVGEEESRCSGLKPSDVIAFNVSVTFKECQSLEEKVVSIGIPTKEGAVVGVYITPLCGCECEIAENHRLDSPHCNQFESLVCGACVCKPHRYGENCECETPDDGMIGACRASDDAEVCSGRGDCHCGSCQCHDEYRYSGEFCQCDKTLCPIANSMVCSGNGECNCGTCECVGNWIGAACSCQNSTSNCTTGENGSDKVECNGHGVCECNKCQCNEPFYGALCENFKDFDENTVSTQSPQKGESPVTNNVACRNAKGVLFILYILSISL